MSGVSRIAVGKVTQGKVKGKNLSQVLAQELRVVSKKKKK